MVVFTRNLLTSRGPFFSGVMLVSGRVGDLLSQKGVNHYDGIGQRSPFKKASFEKNRSWEDCTKNPPQKWEVLEIKCLKYQNSSTSLFILFLGGDLPLPTITDESSVHSQPRVFTGIYLNGGFKYFVFSPQTLGEMIPCLKIAHIFDKWVGESTTVTSLWVRVFYIPKTLVCVLGCQISAIQGGSFKKALSSDITRRQTPMEKTNFSMIEIPGTQKHLGGS